MRGRKLKSARPGRPGRHRSFSLVELVIVVVIIAIIAAIAVPRFSRATASATEAYVNSSIATVRRAMAMYSAEHDRYPGYDPATRAPDDAMFIPQLTEFSDFEGNTQGSFGSPFIYGPYLRPPFPVNPFNDKDNVKVLANESQSAAANVSGWVAVLSNGDFYINVRDEDIGGGIILPGDSKGDTGASGQPQAL